jgi:hypothetical protein
MVIESQAVMVRLKVQRLVFAFSIYKLYSKSDSVLFQKILRIREVEESKISFEYVRNHYSRNLKGVVRTFYWEIHL